MKATVWIVLIALTLTAGIAAQSSSASGSQTDPYSAPAAKPQQASAEMTHTGCVAAPATAKGNYTLKTDAGDVELHTSAAVKADAFKSHVGHTVEVSGKKKGAGLEVTKITMKADSCAPAAPEPKS